MKFIKKAEVKVVFDNKYAINGKKWWNKSICISWLRFIISFLITAGVFIEKIYLLLEISFSDSTAQSTTNLAAKSAIEIVESSLGDIALKIDEFSSRSETQQRSLTNCRSLVEKLKS